MEKILVEGLEFLFNDFVEEAQKVLFLSNIEKFAKDAMKSQFVSVRVLVLKKYEPTQKELDDMFVVAAKENSPYIENLVFKIYNHPKFKKTNQKREMLLKRDLFALKRIVFQDQSTSSRFLNKKYRDYFEDNHWEWLKYIAKNKNFVMDEKTKEVLKKRKEETKCPEFKEVYERIEEYENGIYH